MKNDLNLFLRITLILSIVAASACQTTTTVDDTPSGKSTVSTETQTGSSETLSEKDESDYHQALAYMQASQYDKAIKTLRKLGNKYNTNFAVQLNLATAEYLNKDLKNAEQSVKQALKVDNKVADAHNLLGLVYVEQRKLKQAESSYLNAIKINKAFANAHYNLALLYDIYFQNINKAYAQYQSYLKLVPNDNKTKEWLDQLKYSLDQ